MQLHIDSCSSDFTLIPWSALKNSFDHLIKFWPQSQMLQHESSKWPFTLTTNSKIVAHYLVDKFLRRTHNSEPWLDLDFNPPASPQPRCNSTPLQVRFYYLYIRNVCGQYVNNIALDVALVIRCIPGLVGSLYVSHVTTDDHTLKGSKNKLVPICNVVT